MKILVINAGSSSLKYQLFDMETKTVEKILKNSNIDAKLYPNPFQTLRSVIINLQCAHSIMLTRPLIYTAITRSKDRVIIVGERKALCIAINRADTEKRGTNLATRVKNYIK